MINNLTSWPDDFVRLIKVNVIAVNSLDITLGINLICLFLILFFINF